MLRQTIRIIATSARCAPKMNLGSLRTRTNQTFKVFNFHPRFCFAALPKHSEMTMPALSPTMEKGNIIKWCKSVGDKVEAGDIICEVETDKATLGYEVQEDGYIAYILHPEGAKDIAVGDLVAIIVAKKADLKAFESYQHDNKPVEHTEKPTEKHVEKPTEKPTEKHTEKPTQQKTQSKSYPKHSKLGLPALSPTMEKGNLMKWLKKEGDKLEAGDVVCEVETDKATVGFEVQEDGYLAKILIKEGSMDLPLGTTLAIVTSKKEFMQEFSDYSEHQEQEQSTQPSQQQSQHVETHQNPTTSSNKSNSDGRVFASPLAKQHAAQNDADLSSIKGTGISGSITKVDVDNHLKNSSQQKQEVKHEQKEVKQEVKQEQKVAPKPAQQATDGIESNPYLDIEVSGVRKIIANRLLESKTTIPHYYLTIKINMDSSLQLREELNKISKVKLSVNDFIVKASALALRDIPEVNSQWHGKTIRKFVNADISIAVSTENGLITPIVFNAGAKGLSTIAVTVKALAEKARTNKLKPQEFQGGTFTISNLGMFGIDQFIAVINPPQAAILAVGKTVKNVVPDEADITKYKILSQMDVTLSCDHRVVDGAVGAQWLQRFKSYMESPQSMLL